MFESIKQLFSADEKKLIKIKKIIQETELYIGIKNKLKELDIDDVSTIVSCSYIRKFKYKFFGKKFSRIYFDCDVQVGKLEISIINDKCTIYNYYTKLEQTTDYYKELRKRVKILADYILDNKEFCKCALVVTDNNCFALELMIFNSFDSYVY